MRKCRGFITIIILGITAGFVLITSKALISVEDEDYEDLEGYESDAVYRNEDFYETETPWISRTTDKVRDCNYQKFNLFYFSSYFSFFFV